MRFEGKQYKADDTAANGLRFFFCSIKNWSEQYTIVEDGYWGEWKSVAMCANGSYVNGMRIRF